MLNKPNIPERLTPLNIIPILPNSKKPSVTWLPYQTAKYPPEKLAGWDGNYAIICGHISGDLVVVDFDSMALYEKFFSDIKTFTVRTPHNGCHLYFRDPRVHKKVPKHHGYPVDIQSESSYVLIPPSSLEGKPYEVLRDDPIIEEDVIALLNKRLPSMVGRPKDVEEFKRRINLSEIVRGYVSVSGEGKGYWQGLCPFHEERTPSFTIYEDSYYCFGCGATGDVINFVMEVEHLSFKEAIDYLASKYIIPSPLAKLPKRKYFDESGKPLYEAFVEGVVSEYHLVTTYDNEETFWYCDGYYREGAEVRIKEWVERIFEEQGMPSKSLFVNEVIQAVKRRTYIERDLFNPQGTLNLINGILDIEKQTLKAHSPDSLYLYQLPVEFDKDATCPRFDAFLAEIARDEDLETINKMIGYCLLEGNPYQKAFLLVGSGCNGKTTLLNVLTSLLGRQNITSESLQALAMGRFSLASLFGKLANICADIPDKPLDYTGVFKMLTGEDVVKGERKYRDPFIFTNSAKLIFATNKLPMVNDNTPAFWRRWIVLELPHSFEGIEDRHLLLKLRQELSGVLNYAIRGLRLLQLDDGFYASETMGDIMEVWKRNSDSIYYYVSERLKADAKGLVSKEALYNDYCDFCDERNLISYPKNEFGKRLPQRIRVRSVRRSIVGHTTPCWEGIAFKDDAEIEKPEEA